MSGLNIPAFKIANLKLHSFVQQNHYSEITHRKKTTHDVRDLNMKLNWENASICDHRRPLICKSTGSTQYRHMQNEKLAYF